MKTVFLIFYFFLLFYIATYGIYLYWLVFLYLRHKSAKPEPDEFKNLYPIVTVQLPVYNEKTVVRRLIEAAALFDWPKELLEIQVLDDSDDETTQIIEEEVSALQKRGINIFHMRRGCRAGFKAGALAFGLERSSGEFVAIFDADNIPRSDFIKKAIAHFSKPEIALVQTRWSFLNRDESLLCRAQALFLDAHFYIEQAARSKGDLFLNFNGTGGIWRKKAIEDAGGWQSDTLTEDLDLSYRVQLAGWKLIFVDDIDVPTELPGTIRGFKTQQFRWARGAIETGMKILPSIRTANIPIRKKLAACFHLTQKTVSPALLLLSVLLIPALYIRLEGGPLKVLLIDLPIFMVGTGAMSVFYGLAYKREMPDRKWRDVIILPVLSSIGIGLSINNSLAVISALSGRSHGFIRTPKTGILGAGRKLLPVEYKVKYDNTIKVELVLAGYVISAVLCAVFLEMYLTLPFLMTFMFGYIYFALMSIKEYYA